MKTIYYKNNNNYIINNNLNNNIQKAGMNTSCNSDNPYYYIIDTPDLNTDDWKNFILRYNIIAFYGDIHSTDKTKKPTIDHIYKSEYLGNFYPCIIKTTFDGNEYIFPNVEAAFQASKYVNLTDFDVRNIIDTVDNVNKTLKDRFKAINIDITEFYTQYNKKCFIYVLCNTDKNRRLTDNKNNVDGKQTFNIYKLIYNYINLYKQTDKHIEERLNASIIQYGFTHGDDQYTHLNGKIMYKWRVSYRIKRMILLLQIKFSNEKLADKLLSTNNRYLLEYNMGYATDNTWSDGKYGEGLNLLGICLMIIRDELKIVNINNQVLPLTLLKNINDYSKCIHYYGNKMNTEYGYSIMDHANKLKKTQHPLYMSYKIMNYVSKLVSEVCPKVSMNDAFNEPKGNKLDPVIPSQYDFLYNWNV